MSLKTHIEGLLREARADGQFWGPAGVEAAADLARRAGAALPVSLRDFARDVGNLNVGGMSIIVTGDGTGNYDCLTETRDAGLPADGIVVMENAGMSYVLEPRTGAIVAFDSVGSDPAELERFDDLRAFLAWAVRFNAGSDDFTHSL